MKSTGIVRRIDDLGRLVIPKEIRKSLKLFEGEKIEIYTEDDKVVLKKYSPLYSSSTHCDVIVSSIKNVINKDVHITDNQKIISSTNKALIGKPLLNSYSKLIKDSNNTVISNQNKLNITDKNTLKQGHMIKPIRSYGDNIGSIIVEDAGKDIETILKVSGSFFSQYTE